MEFEELRIYKALIEQPFHKVAAKVLELVEQGRDVSMLDSRRRTLLHHVTENSDKFKDARSVAVVYQLALAGCDVNAGDDEGNTCLHHACGHGGFWRVIMALMR